MLFLPSPSIYCGRFGRVVVHELRIGSCPTLPGQSGLAAKSRRSFGQKSLSVSYVLQLAVVVAILELIDAQGTLRANEETCSTAGSVWLKQHRYEIRASVAMLIFEN
jgi:hypothetical protein